MSNKILITLLFFLLEKQHIVEWLTRVLSCIILKSWIIFDIIYFQRKKCGEGVFKSPCSNAQHFAGLVAMSAVLIQWQALTIQTQISSKLILLQYTQQCIHILYRWSKTLFYWLTHKAEESFPQHWAVAPAPYVAFVCSVTNSCVLGFLRPLF